MITEDIVISIEKDDIEAFSKKLCPDDIKALVLWLTVRENTLRFKSLSLLQARSKFYSDVFEYWDEFRQKLKNGNSFQRNIGLALISANVRWDKDGKFEEMFPEFCALTRDEKPITVRLCIQAFREIIPFKPEINEKIAAELLSVDLGGIRETMRKLVLSDIIEILLLIRKSYNSEAIDAYISDALLGGILDKKSKKEIESKLLA